MSKVRWGHLHEIRHVRRIFDGRFKGRPIMSNSFASLPKRLRQLASWRRMHKIAGSHTPVHNYGARRGSSPSSNLPLKGKLKFCFKRGG